METWGVPTHLGAIMNTTINIGVKVSVGAYVFISLGCCHRVEFLFVTVTAPSSIPTSNAWEFQILHIFLYTCYCTSFGHDILVVFTLKLHLIVTQGIFPFIEVLFNFLQQYFVGYGVQGAWPSPLSQATDNSPSAFASCLHRTSRSAGGESLGPSQVFIDHM